MRIKLLSNLLLFIVVIAYFTSCTDEDPCKDTECGQSKAIPTGGCYLGECTCNPGFEGDSCSIEWSAKFVGVFTGKTTLTSPSNPNDAIYNGVFDVIADLPFKIERVSEKKVNIYNLASFNSKIEADIIEAKVADITATKLSFSNAKDDLGNTWSGSGILDAATKTFKGTSTVTVKIGSAVVNASYDYKK
jgi:hypothetical protein